jgi:hypothetical protein
MRFLSRAALLIWALIFLLSCQGFTDMKELLADLQRLQQGLSRDLHEPNITVNTTNNTLSIVFVNSRLAALPEEQRTKTAHRVAEYVRDHYRRYSTLSSITIGFQTSKGRMGVRVSTTTVPYTFQPAELGPTPVDSVAAHDSSTAAS